jgi:hypothetical protein
VIKEVFSSYPDHCDQPLAQPDQKLFTDRNSVLKEETRYTGYTVVTFDSVLKAQELAPHVSAQKERRIALM